MCQIYVTNATQSRYESYVNADIFNLTIPNLRLVDLWDVAQTDYLQKKDLEGVFDPLHVNLGGPYMTKAMTTIWNEVASCGANREQMLESLALPT